MAQELEHRDAAAAVAGKRFARLVTEAKRAGITARCVLLEGNASRQIVRFARQRRASLITIGTHGRTGLRRLFLGSVAAAVVAAAPCPVLTVRVTERARRRPRRPGRSAR
jgi:nucleotide-binding universal stress UspA family protein